MGVGMLILSAVVSISGIICTALMHFYKGDKAWSDFDRARYYSAFHRWISYIALVVSNATCMAGVINYVQKQLKQT